MSSRWTPDAIPDQSGRTIVVTGPSLGGLGHHNALELARRGARVVLAGRTPRKLEETAAAVRQEVPGADLEQLELDLADLSAVRAAAARATRLGPIDVLVNNAGVMGTPYTTTPDGFELQMATNHFGPFLLTGLLLPQLVASGAGRVVAVSSQLHRMAGSAPLENPRVPRSQYKPWRTYARTKLANLLFTHELDRRCREQHVPLAATAAHPGFAGTHLAANGQYGRSSGGIASVLDATIKAVSQSAAKGAWPTLMAATADLPGGTYVGPSGPGEMGGPPTIVRGTGLSRDGVAAHALWEISEEVCRISYP